MRKRLAACILAATGVAAVAVASDWAAPRAGVPAPLSPPAAAAAPAPALAPDPVPESAAWPMRKRLAEPAANLFAAVPAPRAAVPAPVVAPPAPPAMPYRLAGRTRRGAQEHVYLLRGDKVIEVSEGDELEGGWRVAAHATDHLELVHAGTGVAHRIALSPALSLAAPPAAPAEK